MHVRACHSSSQSPPAAPLSLRTTQVPQQPPGSCELRLSPSCAGPFFTGLQPHWLPWTAHPTSRPSLPPGPHPHPLPALYTRHSGLGSNSTARTTSWLPCTNSTPSPGRHAVTRFSFAVLLSAWHGPVDGVSPSRTEAPQACGFLLFAAASQASRQCLAHSRPRGRGE